MDSQRIKNFKIKTILDVKKILLISITFFTLNSFCEQKNQVSIDPQSDLPVVDCTFKAKNPFLTFASEINLQIYSNYKVIITQGTEVYYESFQAEVNKSKNGCNLKISKLKEFGDLDMLLPNSINNKITGTYIYSSKLHDQSIDVTGNCKNKSNNPNSNYQEALLRAYNDRLNVCYGESKLSKLMTHNNHIMMATAPESEQLLKNNTERLNTHQHYKPVLNMPGKVKRLKEFHSSEDQEEGEGAGNA